MTKTITYSVILVYFGAGTKNLTGFYSSVIASETLKIQLNQYSMLKLQRVAKAQYK
ncbi:MAG: hypothetical protein GW769_15705 [Alphaproteobacteria bacterium]|nr:hypothetical protein [Alphaproteobacteria bacterium]